MTAATHSLTVPPRALQTSRKLLGLVMAGTFLGLTFTGLVMFSWPPREVAMATHYALLGLNKGMYEALHLGMGLLFILSGALHGWLNLNALKAYAAPAKGGVPRLVSMALLVGGSMALGAVLF